MRVKRNTWKQKLNEIGTANLQQLYRNVGSFDKLSNMIQVPESAIRKYFELYKLIKFKNLKIINKSLLIEVINNSNSIKDIINKLSTSQTTLRRSIEFYELPYPNFRGKYDCNEDFFDLDKINEKSMYWSGVLAADGNLRKHKYSKSYSIKLELSTKDKNHLEKFKNDIESNGVIIDDKKKASKLLQKNKSCKEWYYYSYFVINSKKIFDDLAIFGITPQKTYTYTMPPWLVNHPLVYHFVRGYMDADGSYSMNKRKEKEVSLHIGLPGACPAIKQIWDIIKYHCKPQFGNFLISTNDKNKPFYNLLFNGLQDNVKIIEFIYRDATIFMDRKEINAKKALLMLEQTSHHFLDPIELQQLYDELGSFGAVAKQLGCGRGIVRYNMRKFGLKYKSMPQMSRKR